MGRAVLEALVTVALTVVLPVHGTGECPSAAAVERRLSALIERGVPGHRARVELREPEALWLSLEDGDGRTLSERAVSGVAGCEDRAEVAAAIIASWEAEWGERPATVRAPSPASPPPPPSPPAPPTLRVEVGASALASLSRDWAFGGEGHFALGPTRWPLAAEVGLVGVSARSLPIGPGQVRWWWVGAELAARARLVDARLQLDLHAGLELAVLSAQGFGYAIASPGFSELVPGAAAGLRAHLPLGPVKVSLSVTLIGWLKEVQLEVSRVGASLPVARGSLPRVEALAALGLSWESR
ncbi:MAG: hypothetical protein IPJ65_30790 [Archangiaceae bacterium]|nr:hypothetical protein [Archangiaceae bacterium]